MSGHRAGSASAVRSRRRGLARNPAAQETTMSSFKGPNIKKKQKCKNCEGKGTLKKGDKVVTCQRCKGTGLR
jgi:DnaJ-class molecular chaperone